MTMPDVRYGTTELQAYLQQQPGHFRDLDEAGFRAWVERQLRSRRNDQTFQKRCAVRDRRKQHKPLLQLLEKHLRRAEREYKASPHLEALETIERKQHGNQRGQQGISQALERVKDLQKLEQIRQKLKDFRKQAKSLERQKERLLAKMPEKAHLEEAQRALQRFKEEIGLTALEKTAKAQASRQGRQQGKSGLRFEDLATQVVYDIILPQVLDAEGETSAPPNDILVLSNVMLGMAQTELDNLVVRRFSDPEQPVEVLALVEAKRNINDISGGFLMRQQNLAFLTGQKERYNTEQFRTKVYRQGVFDRPAYHDHKGEKLRFEVSSFRHFKVVPEMDLYLDRLYFITTDRRLQGLNATDQSRVLYRMSTDIRFDADDEHYLVALHAWIKSTVSSFQTRDVIEAYLQHERWAQQLLLLSLKRPSPG